MNDIPIFAIHRTDFSLKGIKTATSISEKQEETRLIKLIKELYRRWAYIVADNCFLAIIIPIALTVIFSIKILQTPIQNDPKSHLPYGARGRDEYFMQQEFSDQNGKGIYLLLFILPKDRGSVLKKEILGEAVHIDEIVMNNFTMKNHDTGLNQSFNEFCINFCLINEPVRIFYKTFSIQEELYKLNKSLNERINLRFPVSTIYGQELNLQMNFNGVELKNAASQRENNSNEPIASAITNMNTVRMITLMYRAEWTGNWTKDDVKNFELSVVDFFQRKYKTKYVHISAISYFYVDREITRGGLKMLPYLLVGFAIMCSCSTIFMILSALYMDQFSCHKVLLGIFACICPLMANVTAIGILLSIGARNGSILCITPFLVLAIGVDDAYLMIHAWQKVVKNCKEHPTKGDCIGYRLAEVMMDTGPSILISALTNIVADGVGAFTGSPEITLLCLGNMASIFMDYVYQLTFYSAIMCISGRYEIAEDKNKFIHSIAIDNDKKEGVIQLCSNYNMRERMKNNFENLLRGYVKFITNGFVAFGVFLLWIICIFFSIKGMMQINMGLSPEKLFTQDSPLIHAYELINTYRVPQYTMTQFFVNNPGNLSDHIRLNQLYQVVNELENMDQSWGPQSTNFFLHDYFRYENTEIDNDYANNTPAIIYDENDLENFLNWPEYKKWRGFIRLNPTNGSLEKFFFTTAYHGDKLVEWSEKSKLLHKWRNIIDKYKDLNLSLYNEEALIVDLIDNMPTDAWQSTVGIIISMAFICFIFLYDKLTVFVVSISILSIVTGIIGIASWMDVYLEPIMMSAMLIAMGFSVDIPAHVVYHYNSAGKLLTVEQRLHKCFASVALPAIQASLSTNICMLGLALVPLYMSKVFSKMMVSCITLCLIHGLVLIPCAFALIDIVFRKKCTKHS